MGLTLRRVSGWENVKEPREKGGRVVRLPMLGDAVATCDLAPGMTLDELTVLLALGRVALEPIAAPSMPAAPAASLEPSEVTPAAPAHEEKPKPRRLFQRRDGK